MPLRAAFAAACFAAAAAAPGPIVDVPGLGKLEGITRDVSGKMVDSFLGVTYATAARWELPVLETSWNGVKEAKRHGKTCPGSLCVRDGIDASEDCLHLNVHTPNASKQGLAVMVWIHGGSYDFGCGDAYEGQQLVMRSDLQAVVVTINYRLNAFGFLGSMADLKGADGSTGNWGFLDQRAAITWVREHITAFGGDPERITIFGESAGAGSVSCHLTSPTTPKGFVSKAIAQSGMGAVWDSNNLKKTTENFEFLKHKLNCTTVACMKAATTEHIELAIQGMNVSTQNMHLAWGPTVDGVHLMKYPWEAFEAGEFLEGVDLIAGTNRDEMALFLMEIPVMDEIIFDLGIGSLLKSPLYLPEVKRLYSNESYEYPEDLGIFNYWWWATMRAATDAVFTCPSRRSARGFAKKNPNTYVYALMHHKSYEPTVPHTADLPFVFDCMGVPRQDHCPFTYPEYPFEQSFADAVSGFWTSFAVSGTPGAPWTQRYVTDTDSHFLLDVAPQYNGTGFKFVDSFRDPQCDFWDKMLSPA